MIKPLRGCCAAAVSNRAQEARANQPGGIVMNRDEMEGKWDKAKGTVKENVGRAINDRDMETEGVGDQTKGNVKEGFGKARRNIGEAIEDIGENIKR